MRKLKKLAVAVAVAVIGCITTVPAAANAATLGLLQCNHTMKRTIIREYWDEEEQEEHKFSFSYYDGEEWIEDADFYCTKTYIHQISNYSCYCGIMRELNVHEIDIVHMNEICPEY